MLRGERPIYEQTDVFREMVLLHQVEIRRPVSVVDITQREGG